MESQKVGVEGEDLCYVSNAPLNMPFSCCI
jgi:hypothetical protein